MRLPTSLSRLSAGKRALNFLTVKSTTVWQGLTVGVLAALVAGCDATITAPAVAEPELKLSRAIGANDRPNIIMIVMDDMGYGYLRANFDDNNRQLSGDLTDRDAGLYDFDKVTKSFNKAMPTLHKMVKKGTRFTDGYTTSALCGPSRLSILTGKHNASFGIYTNHEVNRKGLPKSAADWPYDELSATYYTAAVGKWHARSNRLDLQDDPIAAGFEHFYGFSGHGTPYYGSTKIYRSNPSTGAYQNVVQSSGMYLTDEFTREALLHINNAGRSQPLFLYLAYNAIHGPLGKPAPAKYQSLFKTGYDKADNIFAYMRAVDDGLKRIRNALAAKGQLDNTVFLFIADNGSPGGYTHTAPGNSPYNGYKGQVRDGGLRVPMVAYVNGYETAQVYRHPVSAMDLLPTVLDYAGVKNVGYTPQGKSLRSIIDRKSNSQVHRYIVGIGQNAINFSVKALENPNDKYIAPGAWMVRNSKYVMYFTADSQYVDSAVRKTNFQKQGLYKADDAELKRNLIDDKPNVAARLENAFMSWHATYAAEPIERLTRHFCGGTKHIRITVFTDTDCEIKWRLNRVPWTE